MAIVAGDEDWAAQALEAVKLWWLAWERKDLEFLERMTLECYVEISGPKAARRVGREAFVQIAKQFLDQGQLLRWEVKNPNVGIYGDMAICSYEWTQYGDLRGQRFESRGIATHVLTRGRDGWNYLYHHCSPC